MPPQHDPTMSSRSHYDSPTNSVELPANRSSKLRLRVRLYVSLLAIDLLSILAGFLIVNFLRFHDLFNGPGLSLGFAFLPLFVALAFSGASYSIEVLVAPRVGIWRALKALALTAAGLMIALYSAKAAGGLSRVVFVFGLTTAGGLMALGRTSLGQVMGRRYRWNFKNEILLVDGVDVYPSPTQVVVFADRVGVSPTSNEPANFSRLGRLLENCDSVMLATTPDRRALWVSTLKGCGIEVEVFAPELDGLGALSLRNTEDGSALLVSLAPPGFKQRLLKRCLG